MRWTMVTIMSWSHKYFSGYYVILVRYKRNFITSGVHCVWYGSLSVVFDEQQVVDGGDYQVGGTEGHLTFQCLGRDGHTSAGSSTSPRRMNEGG